MTNARVTKPEDHFKPEYPLNKVMVTESGHEIHYDDTPGHERIRIAHKDGTYDEIFAGGNRTSFTVGRNEQYNKSGVSITTDENHDVWIGGHQRLIVNGGSHIEVAGDASMVVGGDSTSVVAGNQHTAVAGDVYLAAAGAMNMNIGGDIAIEGGGNMAMNIKGDIGIQGASITTNSDGNTNLNASGDVVTKGSTTKIQGGGGGSPPKTFA